MTQEDLFEEVVGEISEGPADPLEIYRDPAGTLHVAGTARIEEVGKWLDRVLEHEDVDSMSGLVIALLGRPPVIGDTVTYCSVTFRVESVEGHGVRECTVVE